MTLLVGVLLGAGLAGALAARRVSVLERRLEASRREAAEALALFRRAETERRRLARRLQL